MKGNWFAAILAAAFISVPFSLFGDNAPADGKTPASPAQNETTAIAPKDQFTPPKIKQAYVVIYPIELFEKRIEGKVMLEVVLDKDAVVTDVKVRESTDERFNENAVNAAKKFKFTPARKNGHPIVVHMPLMIAFDLNDAVIDGSCATTEPKLTYKPVRPASEDRLIFNDREEVNVGFDYVIGKNGHIIFLNLDKELKNEMAKYYFGRFLKQVYTPAMFDGRPVAVFYHRQAKFTGRINWL